MNRKSKEFNAADIVFANLVQGGKELISMKLTGVRTLADIIAYLRRLVNRNLGRVVVKIRNYTQGWSLEQSLMMREAEPPQGVQLSLF